MQFGRNSTLEGRPHNQFKPTLARPRHQGRFSTAISLLGGFIVLPIANCMIRPRL